MQYISTLLQAGAGSLASYLAAHVLLCLIPAFFIAGALTSLIPQEAITRYLGKDAPKYIAYPAASIGGFVLAVCSCTIMPLFAGIYKKGAGLGPAITFLFVGPAINILAISFTGVQIGMDIALARIILSLVFGAAIGLIMAWVFRKEEIERQKILRESQAFAGKAKLPGRTWGFMLLLLLVLISGTLQVSLLTHSYFSFEVNVPWLASIQAALTSFIPPDPNLGIESVSVQGLLLILMLFLIAVAAFMGFQKVNEKMTGWTHAALALIGVTLLVAAFSVTLNGSSLTIGFTGKWFALLVLLPVLWWLAKTSYQTPEVQDWLWETWRFIKQIIPLLIIGVFLAGMVRVLIPASWIETVAGRNTLWANLAGVVFGVFMYFPTLVEVPVAKTFLSLGMHRGPLLAYLLADPELSIQSILITNSVIGRQKTILYVSLVTVFSTLAGYLFGLALTFIY